LELNQSNFDTVATQAAVLAGFAVCMIATRQSIELESLENPENHSGLKIPEGLSARFNSIEHIDDEH